MPDDLEIRIFDPHTASDSEFEALNALENTVGLETFADFFPEVLPAFQERLRTDRPERRSQRWIALHGSEAVASAVLDLSTTPEDAHQATVWIAVAPDSRRRGLARTLLGRVAERALETDQRELNLRSSSRVPAGDAFCHRIGGDIMVEQLSTELELSRVDHDLVADWLKRGLSLASDFELIWLDGAWPEADLEAACAMYEIMNTAPQNAIREPERYTPERIRRWEGAQTANGWQRWTLYLRHRVSGSIVAYTEIYWRPDEPDTLTQGDTAVAPVQRGKGLAIWLKAAMLDRVLTQRPEVTRIQTSNAASNEAMLSINNRLGFQTTYVVHTWKVSLEDLAAYLRPNDDAGSDPT